MSSWVGLIYGFCYGVELLLLITRKLVSSLFFENLVGLE